MIEIMASRRIAQLPPHGFTEVEAEGIGILLQHGILPDEENGIR